MSRDRFRPRDHKLVCGDLIEFLRTQAAQFDLVVAADVFGYIDGAIVLGRTTAGFSAPARLAYK
jgi:predicted TPR repeat methyltransferase